MEREVIGEKGGERMRKWRAGRLGKAKVPSPEFPGKAQPLGIPPRDSAEKGQSPKG